MAQASGTHVNTFQGATNIDGGTNFIASTFHIADGNVNFGSGRDSKECLRALRLSDPRSDRQFMLARKDRLLEGSCSWVHEDQAFQQWWDNEDIKTMCLHGNAGKGKTMIMTALVDEVELRLADKPRCFMSYFFCEETNSRANNASAILRGLIYVLTAEHAHLCVHLQRRYDEAGPQLFQGQSALFSLITILVDMLHDSSVEKLYLVIDALDECIVDLDILLNLVSGEDLGMTSKIKWLVSSRNDEVIRRQLESVDQHVHTSLEVNSKRVSEAVTKYIDTKVEVLSVQKAYSQTLKGLVKAYLYQHSDGTFLWVALVCEELSKTDVWSTEKTLESFPAGLNDLYDRMMNRIRRFDDTSSIEFCGRVLRAATLADQPLRLDELQFVANLPHDLFHEFERVRQLLSKCASFLLLQKNQHGYDVVHFVHKSAKDYFYDGKGSAIFGSGYAHSHGDIAILCLDLMLGELKMDMCKLSAPGVLKEDIERSKVDQHINPSLQWACLNWHYHLQAASTCQWDRIGVNDAKRVHVFLQRSFLFWLECLSLLGQIQLGVHVMISLISDLQKSAAQSEQLKAFVYDGMRFILTHRKGIENAPLQLYSSAIIFSPKQSLVRKCFLPLVPSWVTVLPRVEETWGAALHTFEVYWNYLHGLDSVDFSNDGRLVAYISDYGSVKILDPTTGAEIHTLKDDTAVTVVKFSTDGHFIASGFQSGRLRIYSTVTEALICTFDGHASLVKHLVFSRDGSLMASSDVEAIKIWDMSHKALLSTISCSAEATSIAFSGDTEYITWVSREGYLETWDMKQGTLVFARDIRFNGRGVPRAYPILSPDALQVAAAHNSTIQIRDSATGNLILSHESPQLVDFVTFSQDGQQLACALLNNSIIFLGVTTGQLLDYFEIGSGATTAISISGNGSQMVSATNWDTTIWDLKTDQKTKVPNSTRKNQDLHFKVSDNDLVVIPGRKDKSVEIWSLETGDVVHTLMDDRWNGPVAISHDGHRIASSREREILIWEPKMGKPLHELDIDHHFEPHSVIFSHDCQYLAHISRSIHSSSRDRPDVFDSIFLLEVWNIERATLTLSIETTMKQHLLHIPSIAFSRNGRLIAARLGDGMHIWDASIGTLLGIINWSPFQYIALAFSRDGEQLAVGVFDLSTNLGVVRNITMIDVATLDVVDKYEGVPLLALTSERALQQYLSEADDHVQRTGEITGVHPMLDLHEDHSGSSWISLVGEKVLWLPPAFRPKRSSVFQVLCESTGDAIVLMNNSNSVIVLHLDRSKLLSLVRS